MPISKEKNPSKNIERLAHSHPEMPPDQRVAVGFAEARRATGKKFADGGVVKRKRIGMVDSGEHGPSPAGGENVRSFRDHLASMHKLGRVNYAARLDRTDWKSGADVYDTDEQGRPKLDRRYSRGGRAR
jgi:hypothetical protein